MKITDLLGNSVSLNQKAASKDEVLEKVVDLMYEKGISQIRQSICRQ